MSRSQRHVRDTRGMDSYGDNREQPLWLQPPSSGEQFIDFGDPPPGPAVSIYSTTPATEGQSIVVTFRRTSPFTGTLPFRYTISPVTVDQSDIDPVFGTYTFYFADSEEFASVNIGVIDDPVAEPGESVRVTIAYWTGYTPANPITAVIAITDNEVFPVVTVQPFATVNEGTGETTSTTVTFTRTGSTATELNFSYSITAGTATGADIVGGLDTYDAFFEVGQSTKDVVISIVGDELYEPDEYFFVSVLPNPGYLTTSESVCQVTIYDEDSLPVISFFSFNGVTEGSSLSTPNSMTAIFIRTGSLTSSLSFTYGVQSGSTNGASPDDLVNGFGEFTGVFPPGSNTAVVQIPVTSDTIVEADETVEVSIMPDEARYVVGGISTLVASINNDDAVQLPVVSIQGTADTIEGSAVPFYLLRTGDAVNPLTINYSLGGGSAVSSDIVGGFGNFTAEFEAGSNELTILVQTVDDAIVETKETVVLTILPGAGYNVAPPSFAAGIIDNDVPLPDVSIQSFVGATEGASGSGGSLVVTFVRTGATDAPLNFGYSIGGGTASANDLVGGFGPRTSSFDIGSSTKAISIAIAGDSLAEGDETVLVSLTPSAAYNLGVTSLMSATILDDDTVSGTLPQPVLVWDGAVGASTPTFDVEIATPQVGDTITVQWADNPSFLPETGSVTRTFELINLDEITVNLYLGGVVNGLWYYRARHSRGADTSAWSNIVVVTINDITAPVLSDAYAYSADGEFAFFEVRTDEASDKLALVVTASSTPPTGVQVLAGQDHTGAPAIASKIQQIGSAGMQYLTITDVNNAAYAHFAQRDLAGNHSVVVTTPVKSPIQFGYLSTRVSTSNVSAGGTYTFTNVGLGSIANRKIKILLQFSSSSAATTATITVAGQPCSIEYEPTGSTSTSIQKVFTTDDVVSASTGDIVITVSGGNTTLCYIDVYEITGTAVLREGVQGQRSPAGTVLETPEFRIWDGGAAAMTCMGVGSGNVITWPGHVEVYDAQDEFIRRVSAYSQTATPQGQLTKVSIADATPANRRILAASWGPA